MVSPDKPQEQQSGPQQGAVALQDAKPQQDAAQPHAETLPPFRLMLHNDELNTMEDVVGSILQLTPLSRSLAIRRMLEAHFSGVALLLTTHRERGELYVEQFASKSITTTLEPEA